MAKWLLIPTKEKERDRKTEKEKQIIKIAGIWMEFNEPDHNATML